MLNLNPELVDQDKIRKNKRKQLLRFAFVPCLLLLLASAFVLRIGIFNIVYGVSYGNQSFDIANSVAEFQGIGNIITPYIKYFDSGVAKLRNLSFSEAEKEFRASLKENPPTDVLCSIYTNLSLSIELQADEKFNNKNYDDALVLYGKAQSTLYSNGCANKDEEKGSDALAKNAKQRIDGKLSKTMNKINSVSDEKEGGDEETPKEKTITQEQQKRLEQRRSSQNEVSWRVQKSLASGDAGIYYDCTISSTSVCW